MGLIASILEHSSFQNNFCIALFFFALILARYLTDLKNLLKKIKIYLPFCGFTIASPFVGSPRGVLRL